MTELEIQHYFSPSIHPFPPIPILRSPLIHNWSRQGQVTRAQEAEENYLVKRELATVKQHNEETSAQLEQAQNAIRQLQQQQPFAVRTVQRQRLLLDERPALRIQKPYYTEKCFAPSCNSLQWQLYLNLSRLPSNKISATTELQTAALVMMLFTCMTADQNSRAGVICMHNLPNGVYVCVGVCQV